MLRKEKLRSISEVVFASMALAGCFSDETPARPTTGAGGAGGATSATSTSSTSATTAATTTATTGAGGATTGAGGATTGAGGATTGSAGTTTGTGGDPTTGAAGSTGAGGAGTGGSGGTPCVVPGGNAPAKLPFAVDQFFIASGWMQATLIHQDTTCTYPPPPGGGSSDAGADASVDASMIVDAGASDATAFPGSKCWTITYTPLLPSDWAGVDWQFPANNWGDSDGLVIPDGATKVTFSAWGDAGGEKVSFNVGYGAASKDGFGATLPDKILTTTAQTFSIDITGVKYTCTSVRMGFGWIAAGGTTVTFHIANMRWE